MKRILKSALCAALILALAAGMSVGFARENREKNYRDYGTYVLLGDSIAAGYNDLEPSMDCAFNRVEGSYGAIVADTIGAELIPMASPGFRTFDLRYIFEDDFEADEYLFHDIVDKDAMEARIPEIRQAVADAGLITLGLGGNDVGSYLGWVVLDAIAEGGALDAFVAQAREMLAAAGIENDDLTALLDLAETMGALPAVIQALPEAICYAITNYVENWNYVIEDIYALNPDITLVVTGLFVTGIKSGEDTQEDQNAALSHQISQLIVDAINAPMKAAVDEYGYIFVDTSGTTSDVAHPDAEGHRYIAERILEALPEEAFPFNDIHAGTAYYDAVKYVYDNGIMDGRTDTTFAPDAAMTRAEAVEALYRMAGSPDVSSLTEPFWDVSGSTQSYDAIVWAYNAGITNGVVSGRLFSPNLTVSRAQLAAMLYRCAGSPAISGNLNNYIDRYLVPSYAKNGVVWAVENGVFTASYKMISPLKAATRAELAYGIMTLGEV